VWIVAARDGDEVHSTLVACMVRDRLCEEAIAGEITVVPAANVPAVAVHSRSHPLAPTYLEERIEAALRRRIEQRADALIDLHSAGLDADTLDWTLARAGDDRALAMARAAGSPFTYLHSTNSARADDSARFLDGALFVQASRRGVPSILLESGGGLPPDPVRLAAARDAVLRVLAHLGVLAGAPTLAETERLETFVVVTTEHGGLLELVVELGERVDAGAALGVVRDLHGDVVEEVRAPLAGVVLTRVLNPAVGTGTWAFEIGA
jgi:predicted deacylase